MRTDILPRLQAGGFQLLRRLEQQVRFAVHGPGYPVASRAPVPVLLGRPVPDEPGVTAVVPQDGLLGRRGEQAVLGHTHVLSDSTDISGEVKRRFLPGLKAGVSTPPS